jgi:hypothetical protein
MADLTSVRAQSACERQTSAPTAQGSNLARPLRALSAAGGQPTRAIFFQSGFEHSLTSHAGAAWARTPWEAVQRAAVDTLRKLESPDAAPRDWTTTDESPR